MEEIKVMLANNMEKMGNGVNRFDKTEGNQDQLLKEVKELREQNKELKEENEQLGKGVHKLEVLMEKGERRDRRKNIVINSLEIKDVPR